MSDFNYITRQPHFTRYERRARIPSQQGKYKYMKKSL